MERVTSFISLQTKTRQRWQVYIPIKVSTPRKNTEVTVTVVGHGQISASLSYFPCDPPPPLSPAVNPLTGLFHKNKKNLQKRYQSYAVITKEKIKKQIKKTYNASHHQNKTNKKNQTTSDFAATLKQWIF